METKKTFWLRVFFLKMLVTYSRCDQWPSPTDNKKSESDILQTVLSLLQQHIKDQDVKMKSLEEELSAIKKMLSQCNARTFSSKTTVPMKTLQNSSIQTTGDDGTFPIMTTTTMKTEIQTTLSTKVKTSTVGILLFANGTSVQRSLLDGSQRHVIPLPNINKAKFVEFDPQEKQIYWADIGTREIWRSDLCGEEQQRVYSLNATSSTYFISLALDYEKRTIYWTNTGYDVIERTNLNGNGHTEIVNERISSPVDLAIDISNGYLYWLDSGLRPKIERIQLDGGARRVVFDLWTDYPSALALNVNRQELYWNNKNDLSMWVGKTDGSSKRQLASQSVHPFPGMIGLSILDDYIYWENNFLKKIERMSIYNPKAVNVILKDVGDILEVKAMKVEGNDLLCAPGAPINTRVMDVTNTTVTLTWEAGYDWGTSQNFRIERNTSTGWKLLGQSIPSNNQQSFNQKVTGLVPNENYQIRIKACNTAKGCNKERFDVVLSFKTKEKNGVLCSPNAGYRYDHRLGSPASNKILSW